MTKVPMDSGDSDVSTQPALESTKPKKTSKTKDGSKNKVRAKKDLKMKPKKEKKAEEGTLKESGSELTSLELNNWLVKAKQPFVLGRFGLRKRLLGQADKLEAKKAAEPRLKEKNLAKAGRLREEAAVVGQPKHRDVAKAALLNQDRTLERLRLKPSDPPAERVFWKLALSRPLQEAVAAFRQRFPSWAQDAPFFLQRLGTAKAALGQGKASAKGKKPAESAKARKEKAQRKREAVIKRIDLDGALESDGSAGDQEEEEEPAAVATSGPPASSFFVGGHSEDEDADAKPLRKASAKQKLDDFARRRERGPKLPPSTGEAEAAAPWQRPRVEAKPARQTGKAEAGRGGRAGKAEEVLHPSWAAKRAKRAAEAARPIVKPVKKRFARDSDDD